MKLFSIDILFNKFKVLSLIYLFKTFAFFKMNFITDFVINFSFLFNNVFICLSNSFGNNLIKFKNISICDKNSLSLIKISNNFSLFIESIIFSLYNLIKFFSSLLFFSLSFSNSIKISVIKLVIFLINKNCFSFSLYESIISFNFEMNILILSMLDKKYCFKSKKEKSCLKYLSFISNKNIKKLLL